MTGPGSADRGRTNDESRDRAQMVLITALLLATILVGLALVLNSAIYAENQATRRSGVGGSDAVQFQTQMEADAAAALRAANVDDFGTYGEYETAYEESITEWRQSISRSEARRGIAVSVDRTTNPYTRGTRVVQDGTGDFEPYEGSLTGNLLSTITLEHWLVAHDTRFRNVRMTFREDSGTTVLATSVSIGDVEDAFLDLDADTDLDIASSPFTVVFETSGDGDKQIDYAYSVYEADSGKVAVTVYDGSTAETCTTDESEPTLDLATRTFGSEYCEPLEAFTQENLGGGPSGTYDMYYVEGDNAYGTYEFVADDPWSDYQTSVKEESKSLLGLTCVLSDCADPFMDANANSGETSVPRTEQAIYSAEMDLDMDSGKLTYSREDITIAPGDLDEDD